MTVINLFKIIFQIKTIFFFLIILFYGFIDNYIDNVKLTNNKFFLPCFCKENNQLKQIQEY